MVDNMVGDWKDNVDIYANSGLIIIMVFSHGHLYEIFLRIQKFIISMYIWLYLHPSLIDDILSMFFSWKRRINSFPCGTVL